MSRLYKEPRVTYGFANESLKYESRYEVSEYVTNAYS